MESRSVLCAGKVESQQTQSSCRLLKSGVLVLCFGHRPVPGDTGVLRKALSTPASGQTLPPKLHTVRARSPQRDTGTLRKEGEVLFFRGPGVTSWALASLQNLTRPQDGVPFQAHFVLGVQGPQHVELRISPVGQERLLP